VRRPRLRFLGGALLVALVLGTGAARAQSAFEVLVPAGGEQWPIGSLQQLRWSGPAGGNVQIALSRDGGVSFETLFENVPNSGEQLWTVTGPASTGCRVRVTPLDDPTASAVSAGDFTILGPSVTVTAPNGGEVWVIGTQQLVSWTGTGTGNVRIELSRDGGVLWEPLVTNTRDDGLETVSVTGPVSAVCQIRITRLDDPGVVDVSDGLFLIVATTGLAVTAPNGGELWTVGSQPVIHWTGLGGGRVAVELSRDHGDTWETLFDSTPDDGARQWTVTGPGTNEALVRVTRLTAPVVSDVSDATFEISTDPIAVTAPRGGESWTIGTQQHITWSSAGVGTVHLELSRDGGQTWETIADVTPNDGEQFWTVTGPPTTTALVRVIGIEDPTLIDESDDLFTIARGTLVLTRPNGGETFTVGSTETLAWSTSTGGTVRIDLSRDGGGSWETALPNVPNSGSAAWKVPGPGCAACRMRISSWLDPGLVDTSDANFSIVCSTAGTPINPGQDLVGNLEDADCAAPHRAGSRGDFFTFDMPVAGLVTVDMRSTAFDTYLVLVAPDGSVVAEQDGGGAGTDARLDSIDLPAGGPYRIEATSATATGRGEYHVALARFDVALLSPVGGESWFFGERRLLTWRSGAPSAPVDLTLFRTTGAGGEGILTAGANDGVEPWVVTGPATSTAVFQACVPYGSRGTKICSLSGPVALQPCVVGSSRACYTGPLGTLGVGACVTGRQVCGDDGVLGACVGEVDPAPEICGDGIDQDCSGGDLACLPCPVGGCVDDDPCTDDKCVDGECRQERPLGWALFDCRDSAITGALSVMGDGCDAQAARLARRTHRRLAHVYANVVRLAHRARAIGSGRGCVTRLVQARARAMRLMQLIQQAAARKALCGVSPDVLGRRADDVAAAIIAVSACRPTT
jgi:hypothetical protein